MGAQIQLDDISVDVVLKRIKNIHLSVNPPTGRVRISAPSRMRLDALRLFAVSKLGWIRRQQRKLRDQQRETPREYVSGESVMFGGKRYLLSVIERDAAPTVELKHTAAVLYVRPGTHATQRAAIFDSWYRAELKCLIPALISKWEPVIGVKVSRYFIRTMRTRWGSCNRRTCSIRLNTELAKKSPECLEYVVVHEMAHILVSGHGDKFRSLMTRLMPQWQHYRAILNGQPVKSII